MSFFFNDYANILARQMDACTLRQRVIANNVANANTPGFKKSAVNFQQQLKAALDGGGSQMRISSAKHIVNGLNQLQGLNPEVVQSSETSMRTGKNNVDIDEEMVDLAANTMLYSLTTRVSSDRANMISYVIKGGR